MTRPALISAALCAVVACGDDAQVAAPAVRVQIASEGRVVVARVNDRPVFADCVEHQARAHGIDRRAALEECIDFELLAQEAEARGLASHPDAVAVRKREAVRKLVVTDFEANHDGPEDVPMDIVRSVWNNPASRSKFDHPEYRWCLYARAPLDRKAPADSPDAVAAEATARRVHAMLSGRTMTAAEFIERLEPYKEELGIEVSTKPYNTPRKGRSEENFARALFEIPEVGRVSKPVRTRWGWDVILLTSITPELHLSIDEAAAEIREAIFTQWRQAAFTKWAAAIAAGVEVTVSQNWTTMIPTDPLELP